MTKQTVGVAIRLHKRKKADGVEETDGEAVGRYAADPALLAAITMSPYNEPSLQGDTMATVAEVERITQAVKGGDLSDIEAMLVAQAIALQTISASLAQRAQRQEKVQNVQTYLTLSLKAQSNSRATLSALVDLKFPRQIMFAKNVSNLNTGTQSINHGDARASETQGEQSKLLEKSDGQWLDTGAKSTAGGADSHMATVEQIHRPTNRRGKVRRVA